jgi:restriction endonuclease S subunit
MENINSIANIDGFPIMKLEDICDYKNGKTLSTSEKSEDGEYNVMGGGMDYVGRTSQYNRDGETISISKSGASAGFIAYHNKKYWAGDCLTITPKSTGQILIRFLYYFMKLNSYLTMSKTSGSTIPHCKWNDIKDILITVPPLSIQEKVVNCLDAVYSEFGNSIILTQNAWNIIITSPKMETYHNLFEACKLLKSAETLMSSIGGSVHSKFSL